MSAKVNLFVLLARDGRTAVIFRRGPSKQVLLIKWHLKSDTFEIGQWFKGRIYERRCDLSPSGELLAYFAAKYRKPLYSWTAISKPPYLTALALWPNVGAWGGGGLFETEHTLLLNHGETQSCLADGFNLKKLMKTRPLGEHSGGGEDDPIYHLRLLRDGWVLKSSGEPVKFRKSASIRFAFDPPITYEKQSRKSANRRLQMRVLGLAEEQGDWYVVDYEVQDEAGVALLKLPRISWADWGGNGDLLFAERGKLFRLSWKNHQGRGRENAKELADFGPLVFEHREAPVVARKW